jgi:hypothetical protein
MAVDGRLGRRTFVAEQSNSRNMGESLRHIVSRRVHFSGVEHATPTP